MRKVWLIPILILCIPLIYASNNYTIDGDEVYINDSFVSISAQPHTLVEPQWVYFNFTSKVYSGDIDLVWGFNTTIMQPNEAELYSPHVVEWNTTHNNGYVNVTSISLSTSSCDTGYEYNNYKRNITYIYCSNFTYVEECEQWALESKIVCFDSYVNNSGAYTINWHQEHSRIDDWVGVTNKFESVEHEFEGMNKWYYVKDVTVQANKSYLMRAYLDMPWSLNTSTGKYWVAIKRSSDTIQEAISNNRLYYLDPWWNSSWSNSKAITHNHIISSTLYNFTIPIVVNTASLISGGKMQNDCDDLRFVSEDNSTVYTYSIYYNDSTWGCNKANTTAWVKVDEWAASSELVIYMYYGNAAAANGQSHINDVWDDSTKIALTMTNITSSSKTNDDAGTVTPYKHGSYAFPTQDDAIETNKTTAGYDFGDDSKAVSVLINDTSVDWEDGACTVDLWAKYIHNVSHSTTPERAFWWQLGASSNRLYFDVYNAGNKTVKATYANSHTPNVKNQLQAGKWAYYSYHRSSGGDTCVYAINHTCSGSNVADVNQADTTWLGMRESNTNNLFSGQMSFFRISNVERSEAWHNLTKDWLDYTFGVELSGAAPNVAPIVTTPLIKPTVAYTITNLTANTTYTDENDDNSTITFFWYMNDTNIFNESFALVTNNTVVNSTLGAGNFTKLALINVTVIANDGTVNSSQQNSSTLTISNSVPTWNETFTLKTIFYDLGLVLQLNASDLDDDSLTWSDNTSLFNVNGSGYVSDSPTQSEVGNYSIQINATDGVGEIAMNFTYRILDGHSNITAISINPSTAYTNSNLECNVTYVDGENSTARIEYWWYNSSTLMFNGNNSGIANNTNTLINTLGSGNTTKGETWNCTLRVYDGNSYSPYNSTVITISNSNPTLTQAINNQSLYHNNNLAIQVNVTDVDGDTLTWGDNTTLFNINASGYLFDNPTVLETGTYNIMINVTDGTYVLNMTWLYEINNTAPVVTTPLITPSTAYTTSNLVANTTYSDLEIDTSSVTFFWYMNNTNIFNETFTSVTNNTVVNATLGAGNFTKLALINVSVQANDGTSNSTLQNSTVLTILNSNPVWTETISIKSILHSQNLSIQFNATDADSDTLIWNDTSTEWSLNGSGYTFADPNASDANSYSVTINVTDGVYVLNMSFTYEVNDTIPTISTPTLPASVNNTQNITCNATATDAENLTITVEFLWYNGTSLFQYGNKTGVANNTVTLLDTLTFNNTAVGEVWNCTIRSFDGANYSSYSSSTITISSSNTPPTRPTITSPLNGTVFIGAEFAVPFTLNSTDVDADNLSYHIFIDGALTKTTNTATTTITKLARATKYNFTVRATDGTENSTDASGFFYVRVGSGGGGSGGSTISKSQQMLLDSQGLIPHRVQPTNGICPDDTFMNDGGLCEYPIDLECEFKFDKMIYKVGDTINFRFKCPQFTGLDYIISWEDTRGGIYQSKVSTVMLENNNIFIPKKAMSGNVHLLIPTYVEEYKSFRVYPTEWFISLSIGDNIYYLPNLGKIVAGEKTSPIIGWIIVAITILVSWGMLLSTPDILGRAIKSKAKKRSKK